MARSEPADESPLSRVVAAGGRLVEVHDGLRNSLQDLRAAVAAGEPTGRPRQLLEHCAAFCTAVTRHHTAEDGTAFPALAREFPELAPVLAELSRDHGLIADILRRLTAATTSADTADPVRTLAELDGLTAILDSHFRWEEKRLVRALDEVTDRLPAARRMFA